MRTGKRFRWGRRGTAVLINSLFADAAFDSDTTTLLASAFDTAWDTVKKSGSPLAADDQAASTRELLARRIIAIGRKGERDPQRLVDDALAHLTGSK
jgi:hypothetical protein